MAKVIAFPAKNKLPGGIEKRLHEIAKEYIEVIQAYSLLVDITDDDAYQEAVDLIAEAYAEGIIKAVEEMGEG